VTTFDWPVVARQHSDFFRRLIEGATPGAARIA
jgi:hypothetical protein